MKHRILILLLILTTCLAQAQTQAQLLEKANRKHSKKLLKTFFDNWHIETPTITEYELSQLNDTIRQAYRAFSAFYKPLHIDSIGGSEWGNNIYDNVDYLILQNKLWIYSQEKVFYTDGEIEKYITDKVNSTIKVDSIKQKFLKKEKGKFSNYVMSRFGPYDEIFSDHDREMKIIDSILNFRPEISCGKVPIYLTPKYKEILNAFLGNLHYKLGAGGIMNPAKSKGQSDKRKHFLESYVRIWYGHWGGYWQLNSYPTCSSITFDKNFEYAKIQFRMVYEGGETILKNENGSWKLISSKRTWIE